MHWWTVLLMGVAVLTGLGLGDEARAGPLLTVHIISVALIGLGLIGALSIGDRRALLTAMRRLFVFDRRDIAWLRARVRDPFHQDAHPAWGMFNAGQKLLAWALSLSTAVVIGTGVVSWSQGGEGGLHGAAVLLTGILLAAHVFMAVFNPATRPALHGMVFGSVRRSWASEHHGAWLAAARRELPVRRAGRRHRQR